MAITLRHVEQMVDVSVGKPLAWALYALGLVLVVIVKASLRGAHWLARKDGERERKEAPCPNHF